MSFIKSIGKIILATIVVIITLVLIVLGIIYYSSIPKEETDITEKDSYSSTYCSEEAQRDYLTNFLARSGYSVSKIQMINKKSECEYYWNATVMMSGYPVTCNITTYYSKAFGDVEMKGKPECIGLNIK